MLTLLAYAALGILSDILIVRYYQSISGRRGFQASVLATAIPLLSFGVLAQALETHDFFRVVAFCAGNGLGTAWAVRRSK